MGLIPHHYDRLAVIATPREGMLACPTAEHYRRAHEAQMHALREKFPALDFRMPWHAPTNPAPYITTGKWVVACPCGDYPMASPAWNEARCFACGAIYQKLKWPRKREAIEAALVARPQALARRWTPGMSIEEVRAVSKTQGQ